MNNQSGREVATAFSLLRGAIEGVKIRGKLQCAQIVPFAYRFNAFINDLQTSLVTFFRAGKLLIR